MEQASEKSIMRKADEAALQSQKAETIARIRSEETLSRILLDGIDEATRDEILLHCAHPRPGIMRIELKGCRRTEGHCIAGFSLASGLVTCACFHIVERRFFRRWKWRSRAMTGNLLGAIAAAKKSRLDRAADIIEASGAIALVAILTAWLVIFLVRTIFG